MIRVQLPYHLRTLAAVEGEVLVQIVGRPTIAALLDVIESRYPVLRGAIRDHGTMTRRPFIRYYACKEDLSLEPPDMLLPPAILDGREPFLIVGAMAGG